MTTIRTTAIVPLDLNSLLYGMGEAISRGCGAAHDTACRRQFADLARRRRGRIFEKYNVERAVPGGGGEYPVQDGCGWTNGVTRGLLRLYPDLRAAPARRPL